MVRLCVGYDSGDAVSRLYRPKFTFTGGTISKVVIDVADDTYIDIEHESPQPWPATDLEAGGLLAKSNREGLGAVRDPNAPTRFTGAGPGGDPSTSGSANASAR
jgi:hypothetical protein